MIASYDNLEQCTTILEEMIAAKEQKGIDMFAIACSTTEPPTTTPTNTTTINLSLSGLTVKTKNLNKPSSFNIYHPVGTAGIRG